ncbi:lipoprotein signal peptidase [Williamwhitmania taraxaci]|uniref:Lipoprotein signal peptidase n=1 Tax=Williamwhitmania taraxaci TaxID=1640674 RepID=A0A1G6L0N4_9BACT|nr:lipoprotein signal peptidase [Williamwhitmania taraxaci]SDC36890.1 signal peptidase II [Williamwhitmania taraxaci]
MKRLSILQQAALVVFAVLLLDQSVKIWIKMTMKIGDSFQVFGNWFYILFTENKGMAFGMEFGGDFGKLALSLFRIVAVIGIGWYLHKLSKSNASKGLIFGLALVLAGALGNIIDSMVYGMLFTDSYGRMAEFLPAAGGYASFLHGRVVDMLYFPLFEGFYPSWIPFVGGEEFVFFRPIFNIADSSISIGVVYLLIFHRKELFKEEHKTIEDQETPAKNAE